MSQLLPDYTVHHPRRHMPGASDSICLHLVYIPFFSPHIYGTFTPHIHLSVWIHSFLILFRMSSLTLSCHFVLGLCSGIWTYAKGSYYHSCSTYQYIHITVILIYTTLLYYTYNELLTSWFHISYLCLFLILQDVLI
jgi:hypothetical protein